jgi:hypothetical protein
MPRTWSGSAAFALSTVHQCLPSTFHKRESPNGSVNGTEQRRSLVEVPGSFPGIHRCGKRCG